MGTRPAWLDENQNSASPTRLPALSCIQAIKKNERHLTPTLSKYLKILASEIASVPDVNFNATAIVAEGIKVWEEFIPKRDEYVSVIQEMATYLTGDEIYQALHTFFEDIISVCVPSRSAMQWNTSQFDYRKFISYELFLITTSILLKQSKWEGLALLIHQDYVFSPQSYSGSGPSTTYTFFYHQNSVVQLCLEARGRRTQTPLAEFVLARLPDDVSQSDMMQADLILYLAFKCSSSEQTGGIWWPECCASKGMEACHFPIFLRAKSQSYFNKFKKVLGIISADEFKEKIHVIDSEGGPFRGVSHNFLSRNVGNSIGVEEVATKN